MRRGGTRRSEMRGGRGEEDEERGEKEGETRRGGRG